MTAAVGFPTLRLVRNSMVNLRLDDLQPGEWRYLTELEIQLFRTFICSTPGTQRRGSPCFQAWGLAVGEFIRRHVSFWF